ncbi:MAG: DUF1294 domain-containing protein [Paludibacteraceae bacterium]|nr:DUF1294 domain-containing protein [Paludibacteraceae bacterium]
MTKELYIALAYVLFINTITFVMFYVDKLEHRRHRHARGVSTHLFMTLAIFGGSLGELLAMFIFRHKLHHKEFLIFIPLILIVETVIAAVILHMYLSTSVESGDLVPA